MQCIGGRASHCCRLIFLCPRAVIRPPQVANQICHSSDTHPQKVTPVPAESPTRIRRNLHTKIASKTARRRWWEMPPPHCCFWIHRRDLEGGGIILLRLASSIFLRRGFARSTGSRSSD